MLRQLRQKLVNWLLKNARIGHLEVGEHTVTIDGNNITVPGTVDGVDISVHAANPDAHHARGHDHSLAADGTPIAVAGVPNLDAPKITSGRFGMPRMPDGTSGQVLTGQGAGADPAYAAPATKSIATGTYVGNGTNGRQITLGFKCSLVIIMGFPTGYWYSQWTLIPSKTMEHYISTTGHYDDTADQYLHATDGFVVSAAGAGGGGGGANCNNVTFYYWAISV